MDASVLRRLYRLIVPVRVRQSNWVGKLKRLLPHDWIYHDEYYATAVEGTASASASAMAASIQDTFHPGSVVDVGCGTGALLATLREGGCRVAGFEYSDAALKYCRARQLDVMKLDLERDALPSGQRYDLAVSMEVAEHLPARVADRYVDFLASLADRVILTAAVPGQGGTDHINEQPHAYWIEKFSQRGLAFDRVRSEAWRAQWRASGVESWYASNVMIFERV